jgi:hypothetical protein
MVLQSNAVNLARLFMSLEHAKIVRRIRNSVPVTFIHFAFHVFDQGLALEIEIECRSFFLEFAGHLLTFTFGMSEAIFFIGLAGCFTKGSGCLFNATTGFGLD